MSSIPSYYDIKEKKLILSTAAATLKKEFCGIDHIIHQLMELISSWYVCPDLQNRPLIINLWGMTGTGKTSLIKRVVQLLEFEQRFYHFDMGNNSTKVDTLKTAMKEIFAAGSGYPLVFSFDEFQHANTLDQHGSELEKSYSRVVWELLDSGRFQVFRKKRHDTGIEHVINQFGFLLGKGVKVKDGIVVEKAGYFKRMMSGTWVNEYPDIDEEESEEYRRPNKIKKETLFVSGSMADDLYEAGYGLLTSSFELKDKLLQLDGEGTIRFMEEIAGYAQSRKEIDCSKALVFIAGNLDEAYTMSHRINPDENADSFYKRSLQVSITDIKRALQRRFRNEQIARLGNNHLIYPALSAAAYMQVIRRELEKVATSFFEHTKTRLCFHPSVHQLLFREGVFPAQGTRPLLSTIQQLIEAKISEWILLLADAGKPIDNILLRYRRNRFILLVRDDKGNVQDEYHHRLHLPLQHARRSRNDELQLVTAVHESGHAIVAMMLGMAAPEEIYSVTADKHISGFVHFTGSERPLLSKRGVLAQAAIMLGGYVAEKIIFGEENITIGSSADIQNATGLITGAIKKQGMGGFPYYIDLKENRNSEAIYDEAVYNDMAKEMLQDAKNLAEKVLNDKKYWLVCMADYLSVNTVMRKKQIEKMAMKKGDILPGPCELCGSETYKKKFGDLKKDLAEIKEQEDKVTEELINEALTGKNDGNDLDGVDGECPF